MAVNNDPKFDFAKYMRDHPELRDHIFQHHKASSFFGDAFKDRPPSRSDAEYRQRQKEAYQREEQMQREAAAHRRARGGFDYARDRDDTVYTTSQPPPKPDTTIRDEAYKGKVLHDVTYRRA